MGGYIQNLHRIRNPQDLLRIFAPYNRNIPATLGFSQRLWGHTAAQFQRTRVGLPDVPKANLARPGAPSITRNRGKVPQRPPSSGPYSTDLREEGAGQHAPCAPQADSNGNAARRVDCTHAPPREYPSVARPGPARLPHHIAGVGPAALFPHVELGEVLPGGLLVLLGLGHLLRPLQTRLGYLEELVLEVGLGVPLAQRAYSYVVLKLRRVWPQALVPRLAVQKASGVWILQENIVLGGHQDGLEGAWRDDLLRTLGEGPCLLGPALPEQQLRVRVQDAPVVRVYSEGVKEVRLVESP
mmetsp:Transcript_24577/g.50761  ORF Transcript_24577/g.50761 Transcript_24577/m.50761 type:complete len:298 (-) Transcript_24577:225-1118(-)